MARTKDIIRLLSRTWHLLSSGWSYVGLVLDDNADSVIVRPWIGFRASKELAISSIQQWPHSSCPKQLLWQALEKGVELAKNDCVLGNGFKGRD
jgi:hypothetical protein